jgi:hypothetical protein
MKRANLCYLSPLPRVPAFLAHMKQFETCYPLVYLSDSDYKDTVRLPLLDQNLKPKRPMPVSSRFATLAFFAGLRYAIAECIEEFMWVEDDCYVTMREWDWYPWEEFAKCNGALCGGTPVFTNPIALPRMWDLPLIEYAFRYQQQSRVAIALEGCVGLPTLYPNGAFAIYKTALLQDLFANALRDFENYFEVCAPYDLAIGEMLSRSYGPKVFDLVAAIASTYSGCGEHHITAAERIAMVSTKVGIHKWDFK